MCVFLCENLISAQQEIYEMFFCHHCHHCLSIHHVPDVVDSLFLHWHKVSDIEYQINNVSFLTVLELHFQVYTIQYASISLSLSCNVESAYQPIITGKCFFKKCKNFSNTIL